MKSNGLRQLLDSVLPIPPQPRLIRGHRPADERFIEAASAVYARREINKAVPRPMDEVSYVDGITRLEPLHSIPAFCRVPLPLSRASPELHPSSHRGLTIFR